MTLDKDDKKEIAKIVQGVIEGSVTPRFEQIDKKFGTVVGKLGKIDHKLDATMEMCAKNTEDITEMRENIGLLNEKTDDLQASSNRVETLAKSEIKYVDDLSKRVVLLEAKKA